MLSRVSNHTGKEEILKIRHVAIFSLAMAASQAFAQQNPDVIAAAKPQQHLVEIDPMKGCYADNRFYSEGMPLETSMGILVCKHSKNAYGRRDAPTPFEWVKESHL